MKIAKKILCVVLCALLILPVLAGCEKQEEKTTVRLCEVTHSIFYAPQYVAMNLGYFEDEGIEIELTNGQGADKVMSAVLSDNVDIGFAGPEASIYVYNEGKEDHTQVFALLTQRDGSFLVSREPDPNFTWDKLKGKHVLPGRKGGVPYMALEYVIRSHGLDPYQDLTLDNSIQFALMAGAFTSGTGDFVTLFEPTASMLEAEGKGYVVASVGKEAGNIAYTGYFAKKSYLEKNKDLVERFTRAIYRGQKWVANHSAEEIAEAVAPSFPDTDVALLTTVAKRYQEIGAWRDTPMVDEAAYMKLQEVMTSAGELNKEAPFSEVINNSFAEKVID